MTATYWEVGRRIVENEQKGEKRAEYGEAVMKRIAAELTARFGRGFSLSNVKQMRKFHLAYSVINNSCIPALEKGQTASGLLISEGPSPKASPDENACIYS